MIIDEVKKRKKHVEEFKSMSTDKYVIEMGETLITMRPDLPVVRDLLLLSEVFSKVFLRDVNNLAVNAMANLIHSHHFLSFYRGDKSEI